MDPHLDREDLTRLAEEQAALRRVATLVAGGASSDEVFASVAEEVAQVMHLPMVGVIRYNEDTTMTVIADHSDRPHKFQAGTCWPVRSELMSGHVLRTGRPARVEHYEDLSGPLASGPRESRLNRTAGAPIIVDGSIWGVMTTSSPDAPFPDHVEDRLTQFTELLATAISNSQAHEDLRRLADEQTALRRVATLVAQGASPSEVFEALIKEVARLVPADLVTLNRYETDDTVTAVARWSRTGGWFAPETRLPIEAGTLAMVILESGRPGRVSSYSEMPGTTSAAARELGARSSVGAPVIVEGRVWGFVGVGSTREGSMPVDMEGRLAQFTELMATAVANAEIRAELDASRARIVATADATRRRIERNLHDGAQQRLVSLALELRTAQAALPPQLWELRDELSRVVDGMSSVLDELREIAQGIHPAILAEGGLGPALKTLGRRSVVPVELEVSEELLRLPEPVEVAAYYVVAEALANTAKHAHASVVRVDVKTRARVLYVAVRDDGLGGADAAGGSGLVGLKDRVEAIGGALSLESPGGGGTSLRVQLPFDSDNEAPASR